MRVRARAPNGQHTIGDIEKDTPLIFLLSAIQEKTGIDKDKMQILGGFPPKPVDLSNSDATLDSVGIKNGDQLTVKESGTQSGIKKGVSKGPYIPPSDEKGHFVRRTMPGDNSCLFHSMSYVLYNRSKANAQELRKMCAQLVGENPKDYTPAVLGMPNYQYVSWISDKDTWGGAIELRLLSDKFEIEIFAFDTTSHREDVYGIDKNYTRRVFIIYTGNHYDALSLAAHGGASEVLDQVMFSTTDKNVLTKARAYSKEEHEKWKKEKTKK